LEEQLPLLALDGKMPGYNIATFSVETVVSLSCCTRHIKMQVVFYKKKEVP